MSKTNFIILKGLKFNFEQNGEKQMIFEHPKTLHPAPSLRVGLRWRSTCVDKHWKKELYTITQGAASCPHMPRAASTRARASHTLLFHTPASYLFIIRIFFHVPASCLFIIQIIHWMHYMLLEMLLYTSRMRSARLPMTSSIGRVQRY